MNKVLAVCKKNLIYIISLLVVAATALAVFIKGKNTYSIQEKFVIATVSAKYSKPTFEKELINSLGESEIQILSNPHYSSNDSVKKIKSMLDQYRIEADLYILPYHISSKDTSGLDCRKITNDLSKDLNGRFDFEIKYSSCSNFTNGIIIYDPADAEYNSHFGGLYNWVSFDGLDETYSITINPYNYRNNKTYKNICDPISFLMNLK